MNRYTCGADDCCRGLKQTPNGDLCLSAGVHARDLKMAELVGALPHEKECNAYWDRDNPNTHVRFDAPIPGQKCDCKIGDLLAMLETTNG